MHTVKKLQSLRYNYVIFTTYLAFFNQTLKKKNVLLCYCRELYQYWCFWFVLGCTDSIPICYFEQRLEIVADYVDKTKHIHGSCHITLFSVMDSNGETFNHLLQMVYHFGNG